MILPHFFLYGNNNLLCKRACSFCRFGLLVNYLSLEPDALRVVGTLALADAD